MDIKNLIKEFKRNFAKIIFDRRTSDYKILDKASVKKIILLRHDDKVGDMIISTILLREIKKKYPQIKLIVLSGKNNKEIIEANPHVDEICVYTRGALFKNLATLWRLRKEKIDIAVDFYAFKPKPLELFILRFIDAGFNIGFNKTGYNLYAASLETDINTVHISQRYQTLLNYLGIQTDDLSYDMFLTEADEDKAKGLLAHIKQKYKIVLNPFAASRHRTFSNLKIIDIIERVKTCIPDSAIIVISPRDKMQSVQHLHRHYEGFVYTPSLCSAREAAALIKYADLLITPDTSMVHAARAFNAKMIAVYLDYSDTPEKINKVWGANYPNAVQLSVSSGGVARKNNVDNIDTSLIIDKAKGLLNK